MRGEGRGEREVGRVGFGNESGAHAKASEVYLRRGEHDGAVRIAQGKAVHSGDMLVRGPWRRVNNEIVQLSPVHVAKERLDEACDMYKRKQLPTSVLYTRSDIHCNFMDNPALDRTVFLRPSPNDSVTALEHEPRRYHCQVILPVHGRHSQVRPAHLLPCNRKSDMRRTSQTLAADFSSPNSATIITSHLFLFVQVWVPSTPRMRGMLGPQMSTSSIPTCRSLEASGGWRVSELRVCTDIIL